MNETNETRSIIFQGIHDHGLIVSMDLNGLIVDMNNAFKELSGLDRFDNIHALSRGQFDHDYYERILGHIACGLTWREELLCTGKSGEFYMEVSMALESKTNLIIFFGHDVTTRKKNEELVKAQQKQIFIQSQFSALGEMASGIAHEINNPLAIIATSIRLIEDQMNRDKLDDEFLKEILTDMDETAIRINKIINGLRNVARNPESDEFIECTFKEIFDDISAISGSKFKNNDIPIDFYDPEALLGSSFRLLKVQFEQVFLNLINNSFDAIINLEKKWIRIEVATEFEYLVIRVIDSGDGLSPNVAEKLFHPFFTTKEIGKGTGLGLSLSRSIIERHSGKIEIDPDYPYTCFKISLPIKKIKKEES